MLNAGCRSGGSQAPAAENAMGPVSRLTRFRDPLPIMPMASPVLQPDGSLRLEMAMTQFQQKLHSQIGPATVWGYGGSYPGPTIRVKRGQPLTVRWKNDLPAKHILPVDTTLHGAMPPDPEVRAVVHLHGGVVPSASDGLPEDWIASGDSQEQTYPNNQQAATLWYHDHAMGITRLNVAAGLTGVYIIEDEVEAGLNLPAGPYDVPLVIQDRMLNPDGTLHYPVADPNSSAGHHHHRGSIWIPEYLGEIAVLNGRVWPHLQVEPRRYRLRLINASNARTYRVKFSNSMGFHQVATDMGLVPSPQEMDKVLLSPAERAEIVVDFSKAAGKTLHLVNEAPAPFPGAEEGPVSFLYYLMEIRVGSAVSEPDRTSAPSWNIPVALARESDARVKRDIVMQEKLGRDRRPTMLLLNGKGYAEPTTERLKLGTTEVWRIFNPTGDAHPMHLHLVHFAVLDRQAFDAALFSTQGKLKLFNYPRPPYAWESGLKDTVICPPGLVTRIAFKVAGYTGKYVYHCHMLEHEDNDMMRPFEVVA